jgi:hypothetical protein
MSHAISKPKNARILFHFGVQEKFQWDLLLLECIAPVTVVPFLNSSLASTTDVKKLSIVTPLEEPK